MATLPRLESVITSAQASGMPRPKTTPEAPFGARLRKLIAMRGFKNRAAFLEASGLENTTVNRWEKGLNEPRADQAKRAAEALGTSIDVVLGVTPLPDSLPRIDEGDSDAIVELCAMLGPEAQPTDAEIRWLQRAPQFHRMTAGKLLDALRTQRVGMSPEQSRASKEETERRRDTARPARQPRAR